MSHNPFRRICCNVLAIACICCGYVLAGCDRQPQPLSIYDDDVFALLTANTWAEACPTSELLPPSCDTIALSPNGDFSWTTVSDIIERDEHSTWNFAARSENSGQLYLDNVGVVNFEIRDDGLWVDSIGTLQKGTPQAVGDLTRYDLPQISPSATYRALLEHPWFKANDIHDFSSPDQIDFRSDGTLTAGYRDGECTHEAMWSLFSNEDATSYLLTREDPNICDLRDIAPTATVIRLQLTLEDDMLLINSMPYLGERGDNEDQLFRKDLGLLTISGVIHGTFVTDQPISIDMNIHNTSNEVVTLEQISISASGLTLDPANGGFQTAEEATTIGNLDLSGTSLASGEYTMVEMTIVPSELISEYARIKIMLDGNQPQQYAFIVKAQNQ